MNGLRMLAIVAALAFAAPLGAAGIVPSDEVELDHPGVGAYANAEVGVGGEKFYIVGPEGTNVEIWRETNKCAGLQKGPGLVNGIYCDADTRLADTMP